MALGLFSADMLYNSCMSENLYNGPGTVVLTFDDANRSHLETVAPLLSRHGFRATFFITRFDDKWREEHESTLLDQAGVRALADMGFEIGNHTWGHCFMNGIPDADADEEIDRLDRWFAEAGVPAPKVFAYPGGPYSAQAESVIRARGYVAARLCAAAPSAWNPAADDPFRIPAVSITDGSMPLFLDSIALARGGAAGQAAIPVLTFHGVPDRVHPWVNTEPATFEKYLAVLAEKGFRCVGLGEACI